jgi:glucosamine-6-phosphate deaminase
MPAIGRRCSTIGSTLADVPTRALSAVIPAILAARTISRMVYGKRKARAVRCTLEGPLSPDCPASSLSLDKDVHHYLDRGSADLLADLAAGMSP